MLNERDSRKPDPTEPWRYVCPDCGRQVHGNGSTAVRDTFRCPNHGMIPFDELQDRTA